MEMREMRRAIRQSEFPSFITMSHLFLILILLVLTSHGTDHSFRYLLSFAATLKSTKEPSTGN